MTDAYLPIIAEITDTRLETTPGDRMVKTIRVQKDGKAPFAHKPGQCAMLSFFGKGESMISIAGPPNGQYMEFSILLQGNVTSGIQSLEKGEKIGIRGPYGNNFPVDDWKGKHIVIVGGGIGIAPLRSIYGHVLRHREDYAGLTIFYGARDSASLVYRQEFMDILKDGKADVRLSIDRAEPGWKGFVGFVVANLAEAKPSSVNAVAITCGPPIHINLTLQKLKLLGFTDDQVFTTLERKMKCGFGKCGRCNLGHIYTCTKGPVFSLTELKKLPPEGLPDM